MKTEDIYFTMWLIGFISFIIMGALFKTALAPVGISLWVIYGLWLVPQKLDKIKKRVKWLPF
jgi:hypothetical protein